MPDKIILQITDLELNYAETIDLSKVSIEQEGVLLYRGESLEGLIMEVSIKHAV